MLLDTSKNYHRNTIITNSNNCAKELENDKISDKTLEKLLKKLHTSLKDKEINSQYILNAETNDDFYMFNGILSLINKRKGEDYALKIIGYRKPETLKEKAKALLGIQEYFPLK